jgi:hypothetical protein
MSLQSLATCLKRLNPPMGASVAKKVSLFAKSLRPDNLVPLSMARFRPYAGENGHRHLSSVWFTARFPFAENSSRAGRIFTVETAPCTNSCRRKNLENQLSSRYTLAAPLGPCVDQIHAPPSSFSVFRMKSARAFASREEVFRRRRDEYVYANLQTLTAIKAQPPGRQQYGRSRRCP